MMQKYGHRVKVLAYSSYPPSFYDCLLGRVAIKEFVHDGVPVLAFRYRDTPIDVHFGFESRDLSEIAPDLLRREKPDIVHSVHSMRIGEVLKSAKKLGIPCVLTLTDFFMVCPKCTLVRSDDSLCEGPEYGKACVEYCPELPVAEIPKRLANARSLLTEASFIAVPSLFLAQLLHSEFGELKISLIGHAPDVLNRLESNIREIVFPTLEQEAYTYERIYRQIR
jgi:hypothetical protein